MSGPRVPVDVRLVVTDLDGTLLDTAGNLPDRWWPLVDRLQRRGGTWAPASGRQYATLQRMFGEREGLAYIAENGTYVVCDGHEVGAASLGRSFSLEVVRAARGLRDAGRDIGVVWCGREAAYVEHTAERFLGEVRRFFASLRIVDDLAAVAEEPIKFSIADFGGSAETARLLRPLGAGYQLVESHRHWLEVMNLGVNKGAAVRELQRALGVTPEQTVVFGDYLNDLEMISQSPNSYAVANAHPRILAAAAHRAPSNAEHGVATVLEELLEASAWGV